MGRVRRFGVDAPEPLGALKSGGVIALAPGDAHMMHGPLPAAGGGSGAGDNDAELGGSGAALTDAPPAPAPATRWGDAGADSSESEMDEAGVRGTAFRLARATGAAPAVVVLTPALAPHAGSDGAAAHHAGAGDASAPTVALGARVEMRRAALLASIGRGGPSTARLFGAGAAAGGGGGGSGAAASPAQRDTDDEDMAVNASTDGASVSGGSERGYGYWGARLRGDDGALVADDDDDGGSGSAGDRGSEENADAGGSHGAARHTHGGKHGRMHVDEAEASRAGAKRRLETMGAAAPGMPGSSFSAFLHSTVRAAPLPLPRDFGRSALALEYGGFGFGGGAGGAAAAPHAAAPKPKAPKPKAKPTAPAVTALPIRPVAKAGGGSRAAAYAAADNGDDELVGAEEEAEKDAEEDAEAQEEVIDEKAEAAAEAVSLLITRLKDGGPAGKPAVKGADVDAAAGRAALAPLVATALLFAAQYAEPVLEQSAADAQALEIVDAAYASAAGAPPAAVAGGDAGVDAAPVDAAAADAAPPAPAPPPTPHLAPAVVIAHIVEALRSAAAAVVAAPPADPAAPPPPYGATLLARLVTGTHTGYHRGRGRDENGVVEGTATLAHFCVYGMNAPAAQVLLALGAPRGVVGSLSARPADGILGHITGTPVDLVDAVRQAVMGAGGRTTKLRMAQLTALEALLG